MADMIDSAMSWLAGRLKNFAAQSGTYSRGAASCPISMTLGSSLLKLSSDYGERIERTEADGVFTATDLVLNGQQTTPQRGDLFQVTVNGTAVILEVRPPEGEPPWRWADSHQYLIRVHFKRRK